MARARKALVGLTRKLQLHAEDEALGMWSPDVPHVPPQRALFHFMIAVSLFVGYAALVPALQAESPVARRSYPYDGLVKELGDVEANKVHLAAICGVDL